MPDRHARAAGGGVGRAVRQRACSTRPPWRRRSPRARCAAARCGSTRPTRRRSRPTGTSCASRRGSSAASPTTQRFVRRHTHLHAPCEDGSIESGVSHVHPELSPFAPPPAEDFAELNALALARAADPAAARARWRIGEPYRAVELPALLVRARRGAAARRPEPFVAGRRAAARRQAALVAAPEDARAAASRPCSRCTRVARAVADAYVALGEIVGARAASLAWQPRAGGYVRCLLPDGSPEENARFAAALAEAVEPAVAQRYVRRRARSAACRTRRRLASGPVRPGPQPDARGRLRAPPSRRWLGPGRAALHVTERRRPRRRRGRGSRLGDPDPSALALRGRARRARRVCPPGARDVDARRAPVRLAAPRRISQRRARLEVVDAGRRRGPAAGPRGRPPTAGGPGWRRTASHASGRARLGGGVDLGEAQRAPEAAVGVGVARAAFEGDVLDHGRNGGTARRVAVVMDEAQAVRGRARGPRQHSHRHRDATAADLRSAAPRFDTRAARTTSAARPALLPVGIIIATVAVFLGGGSVSFLGTFFAIGIGALLARLQETDDGFIGDFGLHVRRHLRRRPAAAAGRLLPHVAVGQRQAGGRGEPRRHRRARRRHDRRASTTRA